MLVILHVSKIQPITAGFWFFQRGMKRGEKSTSFPMTSQSVHWSSLAIMDKRTFLVLILSSFFGLCSGFLGLGGSESNAKVQFHKGSQFGFEKDPNVYAHFVIPPWNRPFKPGYCLSWEWHTDKKYRDRRVAICKQHNEGNFCLNPVYC